ncbi:cation efflux family-domain-containing protein [Dichotomocladium elegans]|nr:cation efflux family-domain-containing protein [Dichotomocladium elegans]
MSTTQIIELTSTPSAAIRSKSYLQQRHPSTPVSALEQGISSEQSIHDPLALARSRKSDADLRRMKQSGTSREVRKFYREQNALIDHMLGPLDPVKREEEERQILKVCVCVRVKISVYGSGIANVILFALQLVAVISLIHGPAKLCRAHVGRTASKPPKLDKGKERMETAAIVIFACLMSCVAVFLIIESAQKLAEHEAPPPALSTLSIGLVGTALGVKLVLYLYCSTLTKYASARVFAQDHRNDLLVNGLGLTTGILGSRVAPWVDPVGSILIALVILCSWSSTLFEQTQLIVGKSADTDFLQRATYIALMHPGVHQVDTCRAYYAGSSLFVEVDIVLPPETLLRDAHDVGESLQIKLESLPTVSRAFVHVDYETSHRPEHQKTK